MTRPIAAILAELDQRDLRHEFDQVAKKHSVTLADIFGSRRYASFTAARHECMAMLQERGWSLLRLAEFFGVDHTTVMAGCRSHQRRMAKAMMGELRRGAA